MHPDNMKNSLRNQNYSSILLDNKDRSSMYPTISSTKKKKKMDA